VLQRVRDSHSEKEQLLGVKALQAMVDTKFEVGPGNYYYFSGIHSGI